MTVTKWTFYDPTDLSTGVFEVNPNDGGTPSRGKNMLTQNTLAPGGATLFFEGSELPQEINFSGSTLTQSQYDFLVTWFEKKHIIQLTDDLGRVMQIYITKFDPKRVRRASHPWLHNYTVTATVVG